MSENVSEKGERGDIGDIGDIGGIGGIGDIGVCLGTSRLATRCLPVHQSRCSWLQLIR